MEFTAILKKQQEEFPRVNQKQSGIFRGDKESGIFRGDQESGISRGLGFRP